MNCRSLLTVRFAHAGRAGLPLPDWMSRAEAQEKTASLVWRHGVSQFGDLKYPSGFKQFDYVNAKAPKGGAACQIALGPFDNFNMVVAGVKGSLVSASISSTRRCSCRRLTKYRANMGCLPRR